MMTEFLQVGSATRSSLRGDGAQSKKLTDIDQQKRA